MTAGTTVLIAATEVQGSAFLLQGFPLWNHTSRALVPRCAPARGLSTALLRSADTQLTPVQFLVILSKVVVNIAAHDLCTSCGVYAVLFLGPPPGDTLLGRRMHSHPWTSHGEWPQDSPWTPRPTLLVLLVWAGLAFARSLHDPLFNSSPDYLRSLT